MGVKESFMAASMMTKIALGLLLFANFFSWIAFTTTGWVKSEISYPSRQKRSFYDDYGISGDIYKQVNGAASGGLDPGTAISTRSGPVSHYGIWRLCTGDGLGSCVNLDGTAKGWLGTVQAFSIFGFLAVNACLALVLSLIFLEKYKGDKVVSIATFISAIIGGVCWFFALVIYAAKYSDDISGDCNLDYAFGLAIIAMLLVVGGGVLVLVDLKGSAPVTPNNTTTTTTTKPSPPASTCRAGDK